MGKLVTTDQALDVSRWIKLLERTMKQALLLKAQQFVIAARKAELEELVKL